VRGLAGELDLDISFDRRRRGSRLRQVGANGDHGIFGPARDLNHVQVAVAVARIERLDWNRDQKVALPVVANTLAARRVAHTFGLMQRVRDVISESALLKHPLVVGREEVRQDQQREQR